MDPPGFWGIFLFDVGIGEISDARWRSGCGIGWWLPGMEMRNLSVNRYVVSNR